MINWRSVKEHGKPTNKDVGYLVSDGKHIEFSDIGYDNKWLGGSVYAVYEEVSGTEFDFDVLYWCPETELNLPIKK